MKLFSCLLAVGGLNFLALAAWFGVIPVEGRGISNKSLRPATPLATILDTVPITLVKTTDTSMYNRPITDPDGVVYLSHRGTLLLVDSEVEKTPHFRGSNVFELSLAGNLLNTFNTLDFSQEPTGVAYNPYNRHLYFTDDDQRRVFELNPGSNGQYFTADDVITWFNTSPFGCEDPEGIAYDRRRGSLFIACGRDIGIGAEGKVYEVVPGANGIFDGVPPAGDDRVRHFDSEPLGLQDPEGVVFEPDHSTLYILSGRDGIIAETTTSGSLIRIIDISTLDSLAPSDLTIAPASTDPAQRHIYIVDRGVDPSVDPQENDGKLFEVAIPPRPIIRLSLPTVINHSH